MLGLYQFPQIEGWIPIFLFAMLFGLSMDYEVFLVSRMREAWDETHDNDAAVAIGLERTGRIITAAAVIMVAAFSGSWPGASSASRSSAAAWRSRSSLDATLVRAVMVPGDDGDPRPLQLVAPGPRRPRRARSAVAARRERSRADVQVAGRRAW